MEEKKASLFTIFRVFAKIGAFTIGGGYAMLPLIEREMSNHGWITGKDMEDLVVLAQSAPGIFAVNIAIFTGNRLAGYKGSIVATLGAVLPSFVIILLIAMFFTNFKDNAMITKIFHGVRPVAVALILVPAVNIAKSGCKNWWTVLIALATLFGVAFLKVSPIWIILTVIACAVSISLLTQKKLQK